MIMISIDKLYSMAQALGIKVVFKNLNKYHSGLLGMAGAEIKTISLDRSLLKNSRQLSVCLLKRSGILFIHPDPVISDTIRKTFTKLKITA